MAPGIQANTHGIIYIYKNNKPENPLMVGMYRGSSGRL
jgi:hypothetical protein